MPRAAGIVLYRIENHKPEFFLVHPGGPYFKNKDENAWTIPKGLIEENENELDAAKREFYEETGQHVKGEFIPLQPVKMKSGKIIIAWCIEGDFNVSLFKSNTFKIEWPPKSGTMIEFPEADRCGWFNESEARKKILIAQQSFIDQVIYIIQSGN